MSSPLRFASFLIAAFTASAFSAPATEIPFTFRDGFIILEAHVAQSAEPLNLLLDSGAGASVLSLRTARRLRLKLGASERIRGVEAQAVAYHLDSVHATAQGVTLDRIALATDLSMADEICSRPVDGLIGIDFFKDRVVQIDYARHCLRLFSKLPAPQAAERLPLKFQDGVLCVPVGVNGSSPRWTRLDTGCNDALHWVIPRSAARARRAGVSIGFVTDTDDLTLTSVALGGVTLDQIETALHGRPLFPGEAGLLGNGVLSRFVVTIDWFGQQMFLGVTK